jgi:RNA polymerase sigma factor (sigma-70 family)
LEGVRNERLLAQRAAGGDRDAFARIFGRLQQDLYRYCVAILGDPQDAEDALQNTMVKALAALPGEQREVELKPWLYRIAHNESIELRRRGRPSEPLEDDVAAGVTLEQSAADRQRLRDLLADIERLPERQRGALVMRELAGLDFEQIGSALETSPGAARQVLYEARRGLHEMSEGREMDCGVVTAVLSDQDGRTMRRRDIRAHLRDCAECRRFGEEIGERRKTFAAISPLPLVAAAAIAKGALAGGSGGSASAGAGGAAAGGGSVAGAAGGAAVKAVSTGALLKSAVGVVAIVAVGAVAVDNSRLIHWGGNASRDPQGSSTAAPAADRVAGSPAGAGDAVATSPRHRSEGPNHVGRSRHVASSRGVSPAATPAAATGATARSDAPKVTAATGETASATPPVAAAQPAHPAHPEHPTHHEHPVHPEHPSHPEHPVHPEHPAHPEAATVDSTAPAPAEAGKAHPPHPEHPPHPATPATEPEPAEPVTAEPEAEVEPEAEAAPKEHGKATAPGQVAKRSAETVEAEP